MLASLIDRTLPLRAVEIMRRRVTVDHLGRRLRVPVLRGGGTRVWARWRPDWKTEVLRRTLHNRHGAFVDVGANVGQTLLDFLATRSGSPYIAFEPIPECAAFLQRVVDWNNLAECRIIPAALDARASVSRLLVPSDDWSSATMLVGLRPGRPARETYVACVRFDDAWKDLGSPPIGLIKIDVEGAELSALAGMPEALRAWRPPILCEVLYADKEADMSAYAERMGELWLLLKAAEYRVHRIVKAGNQYEGLREVGEFPLQRWTAQNGEECDYLFVPNEQSLPVEPTSLAVR